MGQIKDKERGGGSGDGGRFSLSQVGDLQRANSNKPTTTTKEDIGEICHYSGLLSVEEYM